MIKTPKNNFYIQPLHKTKITSGAIGKQPHVVRRMSSDEFDLNFGEITLSSDKKTERNTKEETKDGTNDTPFYLIQ